MFQSPTQTQAHAQAQARARAQAQAQQQAQCATTQKQYCHRRRKGTEQRLLLRANCLRSDGRIESTLQTRLQQPWE